MYLPSYRQNLFFWTEQAIAVVKVLLGGHGVRGQRWRQRNDSGDKGE